MSSPAVTVSTVAAILLLAVVILAALVRIVRTGESPWIVLVVAIDAGLSLVSQALRLASEGDASQYVRLLAVLGFCAISLKVLKSNRL